MTKSEIFKSAHAAAKATLELVGDYKLAFQFALKEIYMSIKNKAVSIKDKLIELGGKAYAEHGCDRVYISQSLFNELTGFGYRLNDSKNKFYYDNETGSLCRKTFGKKGKTTVHVEASADELTPIK